MAAAEPKTTDFVVEEECAAEQQSRFRCSIHGKTNQIGNTVVKTEGVGDGPSNKNSTATSIEPPFHAVTPNTTQAAAAIHAACAADASQAHDVAMPHASHDGQTEGVVHSVLEHKGRRMDATECLFKLLAELKHVRPPDQQFWFEVEAIPGGDAANHNAKPQCEELMSSNCLTTKTLQPATVSTPKFRCTLRGAPLDIGGVTVAVNAFRGQGHNALKAQNAAAAACLRAIVNVVDPNIVDADLMASITHCVQRFEAEQNLDAILQQERSQNEGTANVARSRKAKQLLLEFVAQLKRVQEPDEAVQFVMNDSNVEGHPSRFRCDLRGTLRISENVNINLDAFHGRGRCIKAAQHAAATACLQAVVDTVDPTAINPKTRARIQSCLRPRAYRPVTMRQLQIEVLLVNDAKRGARDSMAEKAQHNGLQHANHAAVTMRAASYDSDAPSTSCSNKAVLSSNCTHVAVPTTHASNSDSAAHPNAAQHGAEIIGSDDWSAAGALDDNIPRCVSKEDIARLPPLQWNGRVHVINKTDDVAPALHILMQERTLGFDVEWRPNFLKGAAANPVALVQFASQHEAFLFQLISLAGSRIASDLHRAVQSLRPLLECSNILKVGVNVMEDIRKLQTLCDFQPAGFVDYAPLAKQLGFQHIGLQPMVACLLRHKLQKSTKMSNWEAKVLTPKQVQYAAIDAWASQVVYIRLMDMMHDAEDVRSVLTT